MCGIIKPYAVTNGIECPYCLYVSEIVALKSRHRDHLYRHSLLSTPFLFLLQVLHSSLTPSRTNRLPICNIFFHQQTSEMPIGRKDELLSSQSNQRAHPENNDSPYFHLL
mmetsp:Transcript_31548/g.35376  ORF Transcript_31548/g.35376 Transcript_31548/m.35376 type:complete len:110 (+) Transcript_31548:31-360(+)